MWITVSSVVLLKGKIAGESLHCPSVLSVHFKITKYFIRLLIMGYFTVSGIYTVKCNTHTHTYVCMCVCAFTVQKSVEG